MANTFLYATDVIVGSSLCEEDMIKTARNIIDKARYSNCMIHLPVDAGGAPKLSDGSASKVASIDAIPSEQMILDVGPGTLDNIEAVLGVSKTLVWNGPLGAFEFKPFDAGTNAAAKSAARLTEAGKLLTVAGGGDTMSALENAGVTDKFSYISSAGGAFLEWLEGKTLPGVAVLME